MKGHRHPGNSREGKQASTKALGEHRNDNAKALRTIKKRAQRRRNRQRARNNLP